MRRSIRPVTAVARPMAIAMLASCIGASSTVVLAADSVEEAPKDIIAAQIRRQGFTCDRPASAVRDVQDSKPDQVVWILKCESRTYKVRLIPDMAADVMPLD